MLIPDYSLTLIILFVLLSKLVSRTLQPQVVTGNHLLACFSLLLLVFCYLITLIF